MASDRVTTIRCPECGTYNTARTMRSMYTQCKDCGGDLIKI